MDEIYFKISIVNILYIVQNIYKKGGGGRRRRRENKKKSDYNYKQENLILIKNFRISNFTIIYKL